MAGGRPTDYCEDMLNKAIAYVDMEHEVVPSIERLSLHLNVNRSTIYEWDKKYPKFSNTLDRLKAKQAAKVMEKGLIGEYNSTIAKLLLGNHGYSDSVKTDVTTNGETIKQDNSALNAVLAAIQSKHADG